MKPTIREVKPTVREVAMDKRCFLPYICNINNANNKRVDERETTANN